MESKLIAYLIVAVALEKQLGDIIGNSYNLKKIFEKASLLYYNIVKNNSEENYGIFTQRRSISRTYGKLFNR